MKHNSFQQDQNGFGSEDKFQVCFFKCRSLWHGCSCKKYPKTARFRAILNNVINLVFYTVIRTVFSSHFNLLSIFLVFIRKLRSSVQTHLMFCDEWSYMRLNGPGPFIDPWFNWAEVGCRSVTICEILGIHKKRTVMKTLFFSIALLFSATLSSQIIKGRVIDENKAPVIFAAVTLTNPTDSSLVKATITEDLGIFSFEGISTGKYELSISSIGYATYKKNIDFMVVEEDGIPVAHTKVWELLSTYLLFLCFNGVFA